MISPYRIALIAAAGGFTLACDPAFAATFVTGQVNANASAALVGSFSDLPGNVDTHNGTATTTPDSRTAHALEDIRSTLGFDHARAETSVAATWNTPDQGGFTATSALTASTFDPTPDVVVQAGTIDQSLQRSLPAWSYTFDAVGADSLFTLDFAVVTTGNFPAIGSWDLQMFEDGVAIVPLQVLTTGEGSGVFTQNLAPGHRFTVSLVSNDELTFVSDGRRTNNFDGASTGQFDWTITGQAGGGGGGAVPEPATWALTILGFGLTGTALRRRPARRLA